MISNMKVASLVVGALAAVAGAQDLSKFPDCAQWCINNMQQPNKSQELGCGANDAACVCRNPNFLYGVRDCSAQLCGSLETAGQAIGYTNDFCRNKGVDLTTVTSGVPAQITNTNLPPGAGSGSGSATTGSGSVTGSAPASSTGTAGESAPSGSAISTSAIVTTITEGGSTMVSTIGSSTIFAGGAGGSGNAGASGSLATSTVPIVSTVTSGDSTFATTIGSSTLTTQVSPTGSASGTGGSEGGSNSGTTGGNGGNGGATSDAAGGATTTSSGNYAPQMTAAPMGMLAAAGVAAFLL